MPTYDFTCPRGHEFEKFYSKISDASSETPCPVCGEMAVRQISGGAGLLFKGSGFYLTDYGKNAHRGEKKPAEGGASAAGDSKSGESTSGEAKPTADAGGSKADSPKPGAAKASESKPAPGKTDAPKKKSD